MYHCVLALLTHNSLWISHSQHDKTVRLYSNLYLFDVIFESAAILHLGSWANIWTWVCDAFWCSGSANGATGCNAIGWTENRKMVQFGGRWRVNLSSSQCCSSSLPVLLWFTSAVDIIGRMWAAPPVVLQTSCKHSHFFSKSFSTILDVVLRCWFQLVEDVMFNTVTTLKPSVTTQAKFSWPQTCQEVWENGLCTLCVCVCPSQPPVWMQRRALCFLQQAGLRSIDLHIFHSIEWPLQDH